MSIISYKEYKIANDKDYFVKNNMLLEMAQLDDISTLPVYFDDDDIEFLSSFPTSYWGRALHKRYDIFLRKALFERCKQRISVEQAIYDEYVRIIKDFCNRIYSNSKNKEYSNPTKKEIEINFESIKNLEETKNLNISDEEINKIDKKLISYWFNKKVLVKKHNEENLESKKTEDNKQFFELIKTHYITSSIRGRVKIPEVNPIDFQWDGEKFIITTQQQNAIKNISLNEKTIEITYDKNYKNSIEGSTIEITYDYNSFNEEAIKNFAKLETYNIIKKHIPFPVKSEGFDPDKEDDYDFGSHGKIRANSFIIRLIAKLEQDKNELHFEGSGLEGSEGQYGYDLSGGFEGQKICTNEIKGFTVPVEQTFIDSIKEFLSDNHHEYYGKTHEFKNYKDCLGKITGTPPNKTWEKSPDIVILAKYHKKDLYVENTKIFDNIIKFIRNETSENIKKMKEELIKEYGEEAYKDSIKKLNNLHDIKSNLNYTETERKQKFKEIKDDNIKSKFKFAEEKKIKYMPVTGLDKQELSDSENLASQKKLITSRIYSAIKRATNAGEVEIVKFEYFKNGEKLIYEKDIYPMDTWEDVNKPSSNNEKNIYIINIKKDFGDTTQKQIDQYLEMDSRKDKNAKKFLIRETRNILNIISLEIANTIMEDLVKNKQISVPHQKNNYLDHPAKSQITHPEIGQSGHKAGNIVLPHQIKNIKFVGENGEVIEKAHDVALVLPSKPHRPIKSELINDDDDDDDYKDDEEFDNPSYNNNHDNDDKKEKTGYYGDTVILSREEHERYSQDLGVRSPGVKLNSNAKPQKSYPKDTPQYMKAYNLINAREDMRYKTLGTMKINNAKEMKANIVNKIKSLAQDSFNIDELNEESFRPIFIQSICEVYNKINSRKQKIENCFYSIIDYLEEQVTNNLRNPIVAYEEENLNADEIKEKYVALKEWLKWKVKSVIQKSILKNCEKSYESGSRRKQQILVQQMTNVGATISGEGEGGIDLEYITKNQTMATGNSVDLKNIFGNPEDKADTDKNLFPTKHSIETQKEKNKTKEEQDLVTDYVAEINKHIEYNFKNIFDKNNSDDELKYKIKSLVSDYVDVNKEKFAVISNKLKKYILSNIEDMINDQEYINSLKNNITEPITTTPEPITTTPEPITTTPEPTTTTATPPPEEVIPISWKDFRAAEKAKKLAQQQKLN